MGMPQLPYCEECGCVRVELMREALGMMIEKHGIANTLDVFTELMYEHSRVTKDKPYHQEINSLINKCEIATRQALRFEHFKDY